MIHVTNIYLGDWEWKQYEIVYDPSDGMFYYDVQSGCSCNGWETNPYTDYVQTDLAGMKAEVRRLLVDPTDEYGSQYCLMPDELHKIIRKLEAVVKK